MDILYNDQLLVLCVLIVSSLYSDVYEGTRMAREADLDGIRQLLQPLEESGTLIRRTDEEVCYSHF